MFWISRWAPFKYLSIHAYTKWTKYNNSFLGQKQSLVHTVIYTENMRAIDCCCNADISSKTRIVLNAKSFGFTKTISILCIPCARTSTGNNSKQMEINCFQQKHSYQLNISTGVWFQVNSYYFFDFYDCYSIILSIHLSGITLKRTYTFAHMGAQRKTKKSIMREKKRPAFAIANVHNRQYYFAESTESKWIEEQKKIVSKIYIRMKTKWINRVF